MRLLVSEVAGLYRLAVVDGAGARRPLLLAGERPSWAGGWASADGVGGYNTEDALRVLSAFGLSDNDALRSLCLAGRRGDAGTRTPPNDQAKPER